MAHAQGGSLRDLTVLRQTELVTIILTIRGDVASNSWSVHGGRPLDHFRRHQRMLSMHWGRKGPVEQFWIAPCSVMPVQTWPPEARRCRDWVQTCRYSHGGDPNEDMSIRKRRRVLAYLPTLHGCCVGIARAARLTNATATV